MEVLTSSGLDLKQIDSDFQEFILKSDHPCIMAKSLFKMNNYDLHAYDEMVSTETAAQIISDLKNYVQSTKIGTTDFRSFVAVFPNNKFTDEVSYETALWQTLQMLHEADPENWDSNVSSDPNDSNFSFSILGHAFYVIGLHPASSRMARQAPYTTLVFNLHSQFEKLREMGTYENVRDLVRRNDEKLQGSINPVLKDFGEDAETRQYSGRHVEDSWKCPFHHKHNK
ncbi:YqcI/YcgG family protein [Chryseobacterium sp. cx-311]|uniref:guanitoxin biosynthesis heme-dependent pre-guanitoxin N-hydroxylase GntA n=1 Tax=Marnyiella aurantia TaxID=2758037 RepID=UPI001AE7BDCD|nr:guanitoxin biosynthesis heme-dependent pre-guanitoxin N-hydroxylase GntA [Marnyiella aurantia]MBP0613289.1 YqcI/YcgG family protein [Marnyiella aurantia]